MLRSKVGATLGGLAVVCGVWLWGGVVGCGSDETLPPACFQASSDADVTTALNAGETCIQLASGNYGVIASHGNVTIQGAGPDSVVVQGITVDGGSGGSISNLSVGADGIQVSSAQDFDISTVRVSGGENGIEIVMGASVNLAGVTVEDATGIGLLALDYGSVTVKESLFVRNHGGGVAAACVTCASTSTFNVDSVAVDDNDYVGVLVARVPATISNLSVTNTHAHQTTLEQGGGVAIVEEANVALKASQIASSVSYGILVDHATATLGGDTDADRLDVTNNERGGIWVQNLKADGSTPVKLTNVHAVGNWVVGLALARDELNPEESHGIVVQILEVRDTKLDTVAVLANGIAGTSEVGDGLFWKGGVQATFDKITLDGNGRDRGDGAVPTGPSRPSVLVHGELPTGSLMTNVTLMGGDEDSSTHGIVVQIQPDPSLPAALSSLNPDYVKDVSTSELVPVLESRVPVGGP